MMEELAIFGGRPVVEQAHVIARDQFTQADKIEETKFSMILECSSLPN